MRLEGGSSLLVVSDNYYNLIIYNTSSMQKLDDKNVNHPNQIARTILFIFVKHFIEFLVF